MDGINVYFTREEFMSFKKLFVIGFVVAVLVACGDDDSDFATRPSGDSSSACEDCDGSSSSKAKSSSSSSVTPQSSERETSVSSSSKKGDPGTSTGMTSSSSGRSSSGGTSSSSVKSSSSKDVELVETSSSSEEAESSSSKVIEPVKGTLTDSRDGQTYKTVTIGTQTWMAENLNYAYTGVPYNSSGNTSDSTSWCYDDDPANCAKYGRLYTWAAAMDSVGTWSANGKGCGYGSTCSPTGTVRGVCPEGWHLPTQTEWNTLFTAVGGQSTAGKMLKSASGWNSSDNGTDAYSFSALPAGGRYDDGNFYGEGSSAYFWGSSEYDCDYAFRMYLYYGRGLADLDSRDKDYGFSVRCVKD